MPLQKLSTRADQVADLVRQAIMEGRWQDVIPGRKQLAGEYGCSEGTIEEALKRLSREGLLAAQGHGRRRRIIHSGGSKRGGALRIRILLYEKSDCRIDYLVQLLSLLLQAGHDAHYAEKTLNDLRFDVGRLSRLVETTTADAWVVVAGSRAVLEWFAAQPTPTLALFGRWQDVPIASSGLYKLGAYTDAVDQLVALGHRRIVYIVRENRRKPRPGLVERHFLEQLQRHGIKTGSFNLPDWNESPLGLNEMLDRLFQHTPPTAVLVDDSHVFTAVRNHLSSKGILAPRDLSLICSDPDPVFDWHHPEVSHFAWDTSPVIRRVAQWANNISSNKEDRCQATYKSRFVPGGTIGPVSKHL